MNWRFRPFNCTYLNTVVGTKSSYSKKPQQLLQVSIRNNYAMHQVSIPPRYCETDALGHIGNTTLPIWFEAARLPFFKACLPPIEPKEWPLIIARIEVDYVGQIYLEPEVIIKNAISRIGTRSFTVYQEAWQGAKLVAKANTVMVAFDFKLQETVNIKNTFRETLNEHLIAST
ncbi:MAG: acyl-CoA thioester hydrolase [Flavobacteriales bacterium]|jgi:acyl-CoA thioester hydrolase